MRHTRLRRTPAWPLGRCSGSCVLRPPRRDSQMGNTSMSLEQALTELIGALDDPDEQVVRDACRALSSFGDAQAIDPLLLLERPDWLVRHAACEALFELEVPRP